LELAGWAGAQGVRLPCVPSHCAQAYHMFYLVMPTLAARQGLIEHLKSLGILSVFHYIPLHLSPMGVEFGGRPGQYPVTERVGDCILRLPFYNDLSNADQADVVDAVRQFDCGAAAAR
jgi:dTDP-4-amino-4,6-dideoxygalactose transaminase